MRYEKKKETKKERGKEGPGKEGKRERAPTPKRGVAGLGTELTMRRAVSRAREGGGGRRRWVRDMKMGAANMMVLSAREHLWTFFFSFSFFFISCLL